MRYEDASHTGAFSQGSGPDARNDADAIPAGSQAPATGNVITGEGTQTGPSGSDAAAGAHITSIAGAGGEDSSFAGGKLAVSGEFGRLTIDAEGNYNYQAKDGTPENSRDRFTYTLADNEGATDTATLTIEIGKTPAVIKAGAQQVVPGPDGVVVLPAGVELSDIHIVGRNLVIDLPDGTQMVIIDGAVFVPQLVLGGVEVPASNLAALLIGQEIAPAADNAPPQSSGGNFDIPVPPLDPGVPLGDLIPPTEYGYQPPEVKEVFDLLDEEPEAGSTTALLDDDAQEDGNPLSNVGDDPGGSSASGFLPGSGGDGDLTWDLLAAGDLPTGFTFADQLNGDVWILQNGVHVITISIDPATGAYEVEQLQAIDHPDGGNENNLLFTINYTVTDEDGDSATGSLTIDVDDDMPTVTVEADDDSEVILTTDDADTIGANSDDDSTTANFSGVFGGTSVVFGADGAGPGTSSTYTLAVTGSNSGLFSHGAQINLFVVSGVVYGTTAGSAGAISEGNTVFTIETTNTGEVTLTQYQQIDHLNTDPTPTGDPYADHIISMADGLVTLTRSETAVDGDNDSVTGSATINIGANLHFTDDGPTIDPTLNEVGAAIVDESAPVEAATIPLVDGYTRGDDPHLSGELAIGKGSTSGAVVDANAAFGADGPANGGGISYDLEVLNSDSGLTTTEGTAINLVELSNGVVVGVVDGTTTVAFAITIDSGTGVVTVEQYLSIFHSDSPNNFDEPAFLDEGSLGVTVTATDFDGDAVTSDAVDITGLIRFEDDGPAVDPELNADATVTVDESLPSNTPGIDTGAIVKGNDPDLAGGIAIGQGNSGVAIVDANAIFGADGPAAEGSIAYSLSITNADSGVTLTDGTPIELQLVNGVIVGVVDGGTFDGQAAFAIAINPSTGVVTVEQYLSLDHPVNPDPNDPLGLGDNTVAVNVTATDGDGDQIESDGVDISGQITFLDDGPSVAPTLNSNATVTVDESLPSDTPGLNTGAIVKGNDPDLAGGLAIGQANSGSAIVDPHAVFGADGPAAGGGISYELSITEGANAGVTLTDGTTIHLTNVNGVIVGVVDGAGTFGGQAAFAIAIDPSTGVVTVEQYLSLDHPVNPDPNDPLGLGDNTVGVIVTATDGDGDPVTSDAVDISGQITFLDDGPSVDPTLNEEATVTVDESLPSNTPGIDTGIIVKGNDPDLAGGLAIGQANSGSAVVDGNAVFGADGPAVSGSLTYALEIMDVESGLTLTDGTPIDLQLVNGVIVGVVDGGTFDGQAAFAIAINSATGVVTVEQYLSLDHPVNPDPNDPLSFGENVIGVTVTATDGDGDPVTSDAVDIGGQITFLDDGPSANDDADSVGGVGDTATGNVITGESTAAGTGNADVPGADGFGTISQLDGYNGSTDSNPSGGFDVLGQYGTLHMDANGNYTYTRTGGPGGATDTFTYTYLDGDGDPVEADLVITLGDATPNLPDPDLVRLDDDVIPGKNGNDPDGPGDDNPDGIGNNVVNGQLNGTGGDGTLTYNFTGDDTLPTGFSIGAGSDADTLLIVQDQNGSPVTVMTIQLDQSDGSFTVTQNNPILHPADNAGPDNDIENNLLFSIGVEVEDEDHDVEPAHITINVDDDTPTINVTKGSDAAVTLTTDDADTIGVNSDTAQSTANFSGVFGLTQSAGADGTNAAATLGYTLDVTGYTGGPAGVNSGLESHDNDIYLYEIGGKVVGSTSSTLAGVNEGNTVFDVGVSGTGVVTLTQYQQIDHDTADPTPTGGPLYADHIVSLTDSLITLTASATLTDKDGDTVTDSETVNIGDNLKFTDDGPDAQLSGQAVGTVTLDETRAEGTDTVGGTAPTGDASATINFSLNFVTGGSVDYGADGAGSVTYALSLTGTNVNSGLYALDNTDMLVDGDGYGQGGQIVLNQSGNTITGSYNGTNYFTITINPTTGVVTFTQLNNIWHPNPGSSAAALDETATLNTLTANLIQVVQTVTDFDGDTDTASIDIGQGVFKIQDDGPRFGPDVQTTLNIDNDDTPSGTGQLDIVIGTDSPNGSTGNQTPDDILVSNFTVSVNGELLDASDVTFTTGPETATTASYTFTFDYDTGNGGITTAEGTLVFDKSAGTYTVELTNGPLQAFSTFQTAQGSAFTGYEFDSTTPDNTQPAVAVTTIKAESAPGAGDGFYVQYTGFTAGNGDHETINPPFPDGTADGSWAAGDLFSEGTSLHQSWVSVSNDSNGVGGDTINGPDAINFSLFSSDPKGDFNTQTGNLPTASASDMFLTFDGVDSGDDFIVVLKLWEDTNGNGIIESTDSFTTKAIVVEAGDMYLFSGSGAGSEEGNTQAALAGTPYEDVVADIVASGGSNNNDGLVIIESNDYNGVGENWQIVGAQIVNTSSNVTGSGINLDPDVGSTGGSGDDGTVNFNTVTDSAPMKITNIGFIAGDSTDQNATLEFDVTIHDADGDTATTSVTVNIGDTSGNTLLAAQSTMMVSSEPANDDTSSFSLLATDSQDLQLQKTAANTNTTLLAAAVAAAGISAPQVAAAASLPDASWHGQEMASFATKGAELTAIADSIESNSQSLLGNETRVAADDSAQAASNGRGAQSEASAHGLDAAAAHMPAEISAFLGGSDQGPAVEAAASPVAPAVAMVSAEAMQAAGLEGNAKHGGAVDKVLADALGHGGPPTVDGLLQAIAGAGNGSVQAISHVASPAADAVPAWDMGANGAFAPAAEMLFKVGAEMLHHDAVQPVVNG